MNKWVQDKFFPRDFRKEKLVDLLKNVNQLFVNNSCEDLMLGTVEELENIIQSGAFGTPTKFDTPEKIQNNLHALQIYNFRITDKSSIKEHKRNLSFPHCKILERGNDYNPNWRKGEYFLFEDWPSQKRIILKLYPRCEILRKNRKKIVRIESNYFDTDTLFNDFLKLGLDGYPNNGQYYPAKNDRKKIIHFIEKYGDDFIEYPNMLRNGTEWERWTYFDEFNLQYQDFRRCFEKIKKQEVLIDPLDVNERIGQNDLNELYDQNEIICINNSLSQIKYNVVFRPWSSVGKTKKSKDTLGVNIFQPIVRYKILYCYDILRKILESVQPTRKCKCCENLFLPSSSKQIYCNYNCKEKAKKRSSRARLRPQN